MANGVFNIPYPATEEVLSFGPDSTERENLQAKYNEMFNQAPIDVPM